MSIDEAIKEAVERELAPMRDEVKAANQKLDVVLSVIIAQQKDACAALGIEAASFRERVLNGDVEILAADGSRLNFVTLQTVADLKPTLRKKRKRR